MKIAVNSWSASEIKMKSLNYTQKLQWNKQRAQVIFWEINLLMGKEINYDIDI